MGKKSGVLTQVLGEQPKAVTVHCQGHSLSLSVKTMTKKCGNFVGEICILVKFSPKREHLLGNISDNIKKEDSEKLKTAFGNEMDSFQIMYEKVIDNFESFLQLWEECLEKKLDQETKARIVVCKSQMESFYFIFFGIRLSCKVYAMTDNLSKLLQSTMMPAIKGKKLADLVVDKLRSMRNDEDFDSFFEVVKKAPDPIKPVGKLT